MLVPELSKDAGAYKPKIGKFTLQLYVGRALTGAKPYWSGSRTEGSKLHW
jgi:hypothetical protein